MFSRRSTLALAVLSSAASAQASSELNLSWSGGVLGWSWTLQVEGPALGGYLLAPSLQSGPTPLALIDPGDPRVLNVGLDLLDFWSFGQLGPDGTAERVFLLPPVAALVGADLRAQAVELPGPSSLFGSLSEVVSTRLSLLGSAVEPQGKPFAVRQDHAQIALADGRVLLAGGRPLPGASRRLECFYPQAQSFKPLGAEFPVQIWRQEATRLADGRVLFTGGLTEQGVSDTAFVYDPVADALLSLPDMATERVLHTATLLPNGQVLVAGGSGKFTGAHPLGFPDSAQTPLAGCELFDPQTNGWLSSPPLLAAMSGHAASATPDGEVVVTGGIRKPGPLAITSSAVWERSTAGTWSLVGATLKPRAFHAQILAASGKEVLISSGANINFSLASLQGWDSCEIWQIGFGQSIAGPPGLGIVVEGEEVCLPLPRLPKFPTGELEFIGDPQPNPEIGPPILYGLGGGYSAVPFGPGAAQPNALDQSTIDFDEDWKTVGPPLALGLGHRVTSVDQGLRRLAVGPLGARLTTIE